MLEKTLSDACEHANETFDVASIPGEAVVSKLQEDVYNSVHSASSQEPLAEFVPVNLTATEVADSDADVESEADVPPTTAAPKAKSLRKTRTLSLQQKRALANTTESDSDTPASKTMKGESGHKANRLVGNQLHSKNDSQSSDTVSSVRSTISRKNTPGDVQKLPTSRQTEVSPRVTRSRSKSQEDSTSDDSIPTAASVTQAPLRR